MKRILLSVLLLPFAALGADPVPLMLSTNWAIYGQQTNFFDANIAHITNALNAAGWTSGGGGGGSGTVTSIGLSTTLDGFSVSGSPVTDSGTLALGGTLGLASGGTGATNAAGARTALELGTAATNAATAFEPAGVAAADITDSTAAGRALLTAVDAAAQRTALELGTASTNAATAFAAASHAHAGEDITSGTVADDRIASTIARDSEVTIAISNAIAANTNFASIYATNMTVEEFLVGSTNVAEELAAKQPLDTDLTALAAGTAMATAITNSASVGAPILIAGTTNVAAKLASLDSLKAPLASPTFTGTATLPATLLSASAVADPASATNIILNFAHAALTYTVTNNVHLIQSTNRPGSASLAAFTLLRLAGDTVDRTLSWHSSWKRLGTNITTIPSNKVVVLSAMAIGDAETGVTFGIAKEE